MSDNVELIDEEIKEVPLADLTDSEIMEDRAEIQETILSIHEQINKHYQFPRDDQSWLPRAKAKIKFLSLERDTLNAELRHRAKLRDIEALTIKHKEWELRVAERELIAKAVEIKEKEKTERHRISREQDRKRLRTRAEMFYITICKILSKEEINLVWEKVSENFPGSDHLIENEHPEEIRNAIIEEYIKGEVGFTALSKKYNVGRRYVRNIIKQSTQEELEE